MLDRVAFILAEALVALRRNLGMSFAAISTVALSLFVGAALASGYAAVSSLAGDLPGRFEMRVFLRDSARAEDVSRLATRLRGLPGVRSAVWIPREAAWRRFAAENPALSAGLSNPFPHALKVTLRDLSAADEVARRAGEMPEVAADGVRYLRREGRWVEEATRFLRWFGGTVGGLLVLLSGILVFNAIRLALLSRRLEVRVMQLVGASHATVFGPFLIEGALQGGLGGVLAAALLESARIVLAEFLRSLAFLPPPPPLDLARTALGLGAVGAVYGLVCSGLALVRLPIRTR